MATSKIYNIQKKLKTKIITINNINSTSFIVSDFASNNGINPENILCLIIRTQAYMGGGVAEIMYNAADDSLAIISTTTPTNGIVVVLVTYF